MHENSFIDAILAPIENREEVESIELEVGELAPIEAEHLKEHLVDRTGWNVTVIPIDSVIKCTCGFRGRARIKERLHDMVVYDCPNCELNPQVIDGKDIKILKLIYKEEDK